MFIAAAMAGFTLAMGIDFMGWGLRMFKIMLSVCLGE